MNTPEKDAPNLILIGSTGRNAGKTTLAAALIRRFNAQFPLIALKVTAVEARSGLCPRGGAGCGACSLGGADFLLEEERGAAGEKDTARLLAAGASRVFWLRSLRSALDGGFAAFQRLVPPGALVVAESNALGALLRPAFFVMIRQDGAVKPSAARVAPRVCAELRYPWSLAEEEALIKKIAARLDVEPHR
jgi:hypothetical protein